MQERGNGRDLFCADILPAFIVRNSLFGRLQFILLLMSILKDGNLFRRLPLALHDLYATWNDPGCELVVILFVARPDKLLGKPVARGCDVQCHLGELLFVGDLDTPFSMCSTLVATFLPYRFVK